MNKSLWGRIAVAAVSFLALMGCQSREALCNDAPDAEAIIGTQTIGRVFNDLTPYNRVCTVQSSALREGGHYSFRDGLLVINGDTPAGSNIEVMRGRIELNGDMGDRSELSAYVPEYRHNEAYRYYCPSMISTGKSFITIPNWCTGYKSIFDAFASRDTALTIGGHVPQSAKAFGNNHVAVESYDPGAQILIAGYAPQ